MTATKYLQDAEATLPTSGFVRGPITTVDDITYLFRNTSSELDFYLFMKRGDEGWYQSGGPEVQWPQSMVDELGLQIDKFIIQNPILDKTSLK